MPVYRCLEVATTLGTSNVAEPQKFSMSSGESEPATCLLAMTKLTIHAGAAALNCQAKYTQRLLQSSCASLRHFLGAVLSGRKGDKKF